MSFNTRQQLDTICLFVWWCSTIFQLYRWRKPEITTDLSQITDKRYHIMLYTSPWSRFKLTTSVVIGTDYCIKLLSFIVRLCFCYKYQHVGEIWRNVITGHTRVTLCHDPTWYICRKIRSDENTLGVNYASDCMLRVLNDMINAGYELFRQTGKLVAYKTV
jgi:hypothetical protein